MKNLHEYFRPRTAAEAVEIKLQYGVRGTYLGGGSDLLVHNPAHVEAAIDIRHAGIGYVRDERDAYVVGGGALLRDAEMGLEEAGDGMLNRAIRDTAPWLIRNVATLAGNIANASPAADSVPALLAMDAELVLLDVNRESVPLGSVFVGPHQTTLENRLIEEIRVPKQPRRMAAFIKLARSKSDIALVNVAVSFVPDGDRVHQVRIALGAVAPVPMRAETAESLLDGQIVTGELLREVEEIVRSEVRPISDWRASADYRRRMSGILTRRALERALVLPGREAWT